MADPPAKRARSNGEHPPKRPALNLSSMLQEALFWSRVVYGQHPSALLPPPAGLERFGAPNPPPRYRRRWPEYSTDGGMTNPVYGTCPLERHGGTLHEKSRAELFESVCIKPSPKDADAPIVPELSTASFDNHMLTLGRRYGTAPEGLVPACCNGTPARRSKSKEFWNPAAAVLHAIRGREAHRGPLARVRVWARAVSALPQARRRDACAQRGPVGWEIPSKPTGSPTQSCCACTTRSMSRAATGATFSPAFRPKCQTFRPFPWSRARVRP